MAATEKELLEAFCQGARWWEFESRGATMWPSDQDKAFTAAEKRAANGTLGVRREERPVEASS